MSQLCKALAFLLIWTQIVLLSPRSVYAQGEDTANAGPTTAELHQLERQSRFTPTRWWAKFSRLRSTQLK